MKRFAIATAILLAVAATMLIGASYSRAPRPPVEILVIGSDAPGWMRTGGPPSRYLCNGTSVTGGDQVQLKLAVDAAATLNVKLKIVGNLYLSKPAGVAEVDGTCTLAATDGSTCTATVTSWDTGAVTDVAVGQVYRLSSGDDGETNTLEENGEPFIATVVSLSAPSTIVFSEPIAEAYPDSPNVVFERIIGCVVVDDSAGVVIEGSTAVSSSLSLANDQDCALITTEPASAGQVYFSMRHLRLNGRRASQTGTSTTYNGAGIGLVTNENTWDICLEDISIVTCKAEGAWIDAAWGLQWTGGWVEFNNGIGIGVGDGNQGRVWGVKVASNLGKTYDTAGEDDVTMGAVFLRYRSYMTLQAVYAESVAGYTIRFWNSDYNSIAASSIFANTGATGGLFVGGNYNRVTGTDFNCASGIKGVYIGSATGGAGRGSVIVGNNFDGLAVPPMETLNEAADNITVSGNTGLRWGDAREIVLWLNDTGGQIDGYQIVVKDGPGDEMKYATAAKNEVVLGVCCLNVANAKYGAVLRRGYFAKLPVEAAANIVEGDLLCDADTVKELEEAGSGDTVVAIATATDSGDYVAGVLIDPYVLP